MQRCEIRLLFLLLSFILGQTPSRGQSSPDRSSPGLSSPDSYLAGHHYPLTPDDQHLAENKTRFAGKLEGYKILMLAEGGSHFLDLYDDLEYHFLRLMAEGSGVRTMVLECGSATALLCNKYLETGDTTYLPPFNAGAFVFWGRIYRYNAGLPPDQRIKIAGIDFESPRAYFKAFRLLLPAGPAPTPIAAAIGLLRNSPDTLPCTEMTRIDKQVKQSLRSDETTWKEYFGQHFEEAKLIITNQGSCRDVYKNRNRNMKVRLEELDARLQEKLYFCVLGMAHTTLRGNNIAHALTTDDKSPFFQKVAVINTYCDQCSTPKEPVSNWPLKEMENDIRSTLIGYCTQDITLFDWSQPVDPATTRWRSFGQYLLIARNQH